MSAVPPPVGPDLRIWANQLVSFLKRSAALLRYKDATMTPAINGSIVWNEDAGYPEVAKDGAWRQIVMADGYAMLTVTADVIPAAANTAYAITWDSPALVGTGISVSGSEVTFVEAGLYEIAFTAQIQSSSASAINFWFWPRINTVDAAGSTMKASLHNNGGTIVVARTALFPFEAGDVLEAMWAVDSTSGILSEEAATSFAPETPAVTMSISRVQA